MKKYYLTKMIRNGLWFTSIVLVCCLGWFAVGNTEGPEVVDRIIAVVNDDIISLFEFNQILKPYEEKVKTMGYPEDKAREMLYKVREGILNQLVEQKLTDQQVKELKITISDKEIDTAIERIKESNYITDEDLKKNLSKEGLTMEEYRNRIKEQILRGKLLNYEIKSKVVITKDDIKSYYESHSEYQGEKKYHLRHIMLKVSPIASESEKDAVKIKMESIMAELKEGKPFEQLAEKYSESLSASKGGELGVFLSDELSPQLQTAIRNLKAGEFTSILDTDQGYQIFFLQEIINTKGKSLEDASNEIEEKLFDEVIEQKFRSWVEDLRKRSFIKIIR